MRAGVEEDEPRAVGRHAAAGEHLRVQRAAERVGGEDVEAVVADERRDAGHGVEDVLDARPDALLRPAPPRRGRVRRPCEVEEMGALDLVELERACERVEDGVGDAGGVAALEPRVVVDAEPGMQRDLFATQARNAALAAAVGAQAHMLRCHAPPP